MPNKYYSQDTGYSNRGGRKAPKNKRGVSGPTSMPEGTASWPGVPGKTQPRSRANSIKTTGYRGAFHHKKVGI